MLAWRPRWEWRVSWFFSPDLSRYHYCGRSITLTLAPWMLIFCNVETNCAKSASTFCKNWKFATKSVTPFFLPPALPYWRLCIEPCVILWTQGRGWLVDNFRHVLQQAKREGEGKRCQIVCTDVSSIKQDLDRLWDFAAALQDEHPGSAMPIVPAYTS